MPSRNLVLAPDEIYHIFNRGVARLPIFSRTKDYQRFLSLVDYYRFEETPTSYSHFNKLPEEMKEEIMASMQKEKKLHVKILAFCLIPNHFHFILKQVSEFGITTFMRNLQNGYVKYFNLKEDRVGPLFQSMFKSVRVESDEQLVHLSRYIHLNPSTSFLVKIENLEKYPWSSFKDYLSDNSAHFTHTEIVMGFFKNKDKYKEFVFNQADYQKELSRLKHLVLE